MELGALLPLGDIGGAPPVLREYAQAAESIGYDFIEAPDHVLGVNVATRPDWGDRNTSADLFHDHPGTNLTTLFGPQHGIRGDVQDNMIETEHATDRKTGLPIYSLYSETREPTEEMLRDVDVIVFDLQDVGTRIYEKLAAIRAGDPVADLDDTHII